MPVTWPIVTRPVKTDSSTRNLWGRTRAGAPIIPASDNPFGVDSEPAPQ
jgi:hypothetical protein